MKTDDLRLNTVAESSQWTPLLNGAHQPGWFRLWAGMVQVVGLAGTEEALEEGMQRLELGVRYTNDTETG